MKTNIPALGLKLRRDMECKKEMTLNEYQQRALTTCMPSCNNFTYMMLNLVGEVGELAGKIAKTVRKEQTSIVVNNLDSTDMVAEERQALYDDLKSEAGDIAWQLVGLCHVMGWDFEEVCQGNLDKLSNRKKEGTIITHTDH